MIVIGGDDGFSRDITKRHAARRPESFVVGVRGADAERLTHGTGSSAGVRLPVDGGRTI
jgi:hypothetical protein